MTRTSNAAFFVETENQLESKSFVKKVNNQKYTNCATECDRIEEGNAPINLKAKLQTLNRFDPDHSQSSLVLAKFPRG